MIRLMSTVATASSAEKPKGISRSRSRNHRRYHVFEAAFTVPHTSSPTTHADMANKEPATILAGYRFDGQSTATPVPVSKKQP
jgi:hypothetical protein